MPIRKPDSNVELAESREALGKAFRRWRERNGLSQQVIHNFAQAKKIPLHNSQEAHFENGVLDPKAPFYISLGVLMDCSANKKFPPTQEGFSKSDRDRLKEAEPYLDSENNIADAVCFFAQFIGEEAINELYLTKTIEKITPEHVVNVSDFDRTVFRGFATDQLMDKREAWDSLLKHLEGVINKKQQRRMQAVCAGQDDWTLEEISTFTNDGKRNHCVIADALAEWTSKKMPEPVDIWTKGSKMKWPKLA